MDAQIKGILTSILLAVSMAVTTWGVAHGIIPSADQNVIANDLVTAIFAGVTALAGWYQSRQTTQSAMISAVNNADNGVKVVAATVPAPTVTAPLKEAGK